MSNVRHIGDCDYFVSTDKKLLDYDWTIAAIKRQYWGGWRDTNRILTSLAGSVCFGLYECNGDTVQVGFARVVSDHATFSWVCDVVIDEDRRGKGLGKFLMEYVMAHPSVADTVSMLGTRDAHGLYEKFGYERWEGMRRIPR